jgi:hypothetical protein
MTEKEMYQNHLKKFNTVVEFTRVESGNLKCGIPDIYFLSRINSKHGWIELKVAYIKNNIINIDYRPGQINWIRNHTSKGLTSYTLIYFNRKFYLSNDFMNSFKNERTLENYSLWHGLSLDKSFIKSIIC